MPDDLGWIPTFFAVFARTSAVFSFVPIPGLKAPVSAARIGLSLTLSLALLPSCPRLAASSLDLSNILLILLFESCMGLSAGLLLSFFFEVFQFAAQMLSQQAGFSYAATIDPNNNTDSGVLLVLSQLLVGLVCLSMGLDRHIITALGDSLRAVPPGSFRLTPNDFETVQKAGAAIFQIGPTLALPSVAVFLCIDILLGILSRVEQQLQLTTILFPLKTAGSFALVVLIFSAYPGVISQLLQTTIAGIRHALGV